MSSHEEHDMQRAADLNVTAPALMPGPVQATPQAPRPSWTAHPIAVLAIILVSSPPHSSSPSSSALAATRHGQTSSHH